MKKLTTQEFVDRARAVHCDRYGYAFSVYQGNHVKLMIHCREHGFFEMTPANHNSGHGCPVCDIRLMQGDCLERMKEIPSCSVDMVLTDPPYGTTACKWDSIIPMEPMWEQLNRIIKPNGAIVLFGSQPFTSSLIMSNLKMFKYEQIWDKNKGTQPQLANIQPMKSHENILVFGKGKINYYPQKTKGDPYTRDNKQNHTEHSLSKGLKPIKQVNTGFRFPKTVLMYPRDFSAQTRLHPTQKPVALMEYLIKTYTNEGETILDFAMGSCTTGVACANTGRKFIGIELDAGYFEVASNRIGEASAKQD